MSPMDSTAQRPPPLDTQHRHRECLDSRVASPEVPLRCRGTCVHADPPAWSWSLSQVSPASLAADTPHAMSPTQDLSGLSCPVTLHDPTIQPRPVGRCTYPPKLVSLHPLHLCTPTLGHGFDAEQPECPPMLLLCRAPGLLGEAQLSLPVTFLSHGNLCRPSWGTLCDPRLQLRI